MKRAVLLCLIGVLAVRVVSFGLLVGVFSVTARLCGCLKSSGIGFVDTS